VLREYWDKRITIFLVVENAQRVLLEGIDISMLLSSGAAEAE